MINDKMLNDSLLNSLPIELVSTILNDFVSIHRDMSASDVACSPSVRPAYTAALRYVSIQDSAHCKTDNAMKNYIDWTIARSVQISHLEVRWGRDRKGFTGSPIKHLARLSDAFMKNVSKLSFVEETSCFEKVDAVEEFDIFSLSCTDMCLFRDTLSHQHGRSGGPTFKISAAFADISL